MWYSQTIDRQPHGDMDYFNYRYYTEAEREAYVAELKVAMLAANCREFNPVNSGTLSEILKWSEQNEIAGVSDPNELVREFIHKKVGLDTVDLAQSVFQASRGNNSSQPTLFALAALNLRRQRTSMCRRIAVSAGNFSATADLLEERGNSYAQGFFNDKIMHPIVRMGRTSSAKWGAETGAVIVARVWRSLLKLQRLRDPLDTSSLLPHALLSGTPKLFYGVSQEIQFLRMVVIAALDPSRPTLSEVVKQHLVKCFSCNIDRLSLAKDINVIAVSMRSAWHTYRSALSRHIMVEVVAEEMGFGAPEALPMNAVARSFRRNLRRAIANA